MKSVFTSRKQTYAIALIISMLAITTMFIPVAAHADPITFGMPSQDSCDSGSTNYTWDGLGLDRPVITSMSVDGETIVDPTTPVDGGIGAVVCPNTDLANRTGLSVFRRDGSDYFADLDGALTPAGHPITANSDITITLDDLGELAQYYSFSLVHGLVSNWETSDLGTPDATLSVSLSPVLTPMAAGGEEFGGCTATPPHCDANKSDADLLSAGLDMTFNQGDDHNEFVGAYFALVGAMGGFVQAQGSHLVASLGAPHFLANGTTPNTGSMSAFLPNSVLDSIFGLSPGTVDENTFSVTRTEGSETTTGIPFTVTPVTGGIIVAVDDITFSSPSYSIGLAGDENEIPFPKNNVDTITPSGKRVALGVDDESVTIVSYGTSVASAAFPDIGRSYPFGLLSFTLTVPTGSTQHISVGWETSESPTNFVLRKYNATTHAYSSVPGAVLTSETFGVIHTIIATYDITDGGPLDADGVANGTIVDPIGLGTIPASTLPASTLPATGSHDLGIQLEVTAMLMALGALLLFTSRRRPVLATVEK